MVHITAKMDVNASECQAMEKKSFAFKLTDKKQDKGKWMPRDGVAAAGCTDPHGTFDYRYGNDYGYWC